MIPWHVAALAVAVTALAAYALGRDRGYWRAWQHGYDRGRREGHQAGRSERWAALVRLWADREEASW
jgi:flagellar biosynthesis/type III secretory pathway protein FliH